MSLKLLVGNVAVEATEHSLKEFFSTCGRVKAVTIPRTDTGRARGFAFVEMTSHKEAVAAQAELEGANFNGRKLTVTLGDAEQAKPVGFFSWLRLFCA